LDTTSNITAEQGAGPRRYVFGVFVLDLDRGTLQKKGADVPLRPKCFEVLCYLVKNHGVLLSKNNLLSAVWTDVIVTDDSLTHCLIEIRRALGDDSKEMVRTLPRRGYLFDVPVTVHQPGEVQESVQEPVSSQHHRKPSPWSVGAAIVLALAIFAIWISGRQRADEFALKELRVTALPTSIAVLPFADMSPESDQEYFADGLSEEILNLLAQTPDLTVIARTSSFSFKGRNPDIEVIAQKLNVANVLEGSVRKNGDQIRVTAQLVDASNSAHLWSQTYDRTLDNIFSVQSEIASAVAEVLKVRLLGESFATTTETHQAYLRGRYLVAQRTQAAVKAAIREFEKAVSLDPNYALAYAELSLATRRLSFHGEMTRAEAIAIAAPYAERAMALDPTLAQAHAATGYVWVTPETIEIAVTHFRRAIELNSNYSDAYLWLGNFLNVLGDYDEGFSMHVKAVQLDPLSLPANSNYAQGLIARNRLDEADRQLEKLASIAPGYYAESGLPVIRSSLDGRWADGLLAGLDSLRYDTNSSAAIDLAFGFAVIGLEKEALALFETPPPFVFTFMGKPAEEIAAAEARLANGPLGLYSRLAFGLALADAGEYARARNVLEKSWHENNNLVNTDYFTTDAAMALIAIRRDVGEEAGVGELRAAIQDNVRRYHEAGITRGTLFWSVDYEEGVTAFLTGNREGGLASIAKAAEDGYFIQPNAAYLQALYDDPGFAPILAAQQARQARERDRFLNVVCNNNPYQEVWRPQPGTCRQYLSENFQ
jgi:TolB-like protein/DNA-binding winged helix-turn-helix (wHTH) protein/Tfp pilus assembly protein PilF